MSDQSSDVVLSFGISIVGLVRMRIFVLRHVTEGVYVRSFISNRANAAVA
jgi:hypothetical protein